MLLGPAGVGKTCFKRGLMNLPFNSNTNSTILADVQSVRPLSRQWIMSDSWTEVTEEDEIKELALLMVMAGSIDEELKWPSIKFLNNDQYRSEQYPAAALYDRLQKLLESEIVQKAIARAIVIKEIDRVHDLKCQPFFHLWDCGGQPVFLEVLPIFLTARTVFLLLFNAALDLSKPWRPVYNIDGKQHVEPGEVNLSTLQMMERWVALISSYLLQSDTAGVDPGYPRVIPIGTRGDEVKRNGRKPDEVFASLDDCISGKPTLHHVLKGRHIIDNTTSGTENEDPAYKKVREEVFNITFAKLKKKTPISWILFRKLLQLQASEFRSNIISLDESKAIGSIAKVEPENVPSVLSFYHELGVVLYYPHIESLKEKVVLNPQWFVDCLGKVLSLPVALDKSYEVEWELLHNKGILVQSLYTSVWSQCQGVGPEEFIELLTFFQLAVEVKTKEYFNKDIKQYFVPSVLPYATKSVVVDSTTTCTAAPLHITFAAGIAIPGFFTRLSAMMLQPVREDSPILELYFKKGIFHNQVTYRMKDLPSHFVTLTEKAHVIEVELTCTALQPASNIQKLCSNLKSLVQTSCEKVQRCLQSILCITQVSSFELKVVCQAMECQEENKIHYLMLTPYQPLTQQGVHTPVVCEMNEEYFKFRNITIEEAYWYDVPCSSVKSLDTQVSVPLASTATAGVKYCTSLRGRGEQVDGAGGRQTVDASVQCSLLEPTRTTSTPPIQLHCRRSTAGTPTVEGVYQQLKKKSALWDDFGRELGVSLNYREELQREQMSNKGRLEKVLAKWIDSNCSEVSWQKIIEILNELELVQMARDVAAKYTSQDN